MDGNILVLPFSILVGEESMLVFCSASITMFREDNCSAFLSRIGADITVAFLPVLALEPLRFLSFSSFSPSVKKSFLTHYFLVL